VVPPVASPVEPPALAADPAAAPSVQSAPVSKFELNVAFVTSAVDARKRSFSASGTPKPNYPKSFNALGADLGLGTSQLMGATLTMSYQYRPWTIGLLWSQQWRVAQDTQLGALSALVDNESLSLIDIGIFAAVDLPIGTGALRFGAASSLRLLQVDTLQLEFTNCSRRRGTYACAVAARAPASVVFEPRIQALLPLYGSASGTEGVFLAPYVGYDLLGGSLSMGLGIAAQGRPQVILRPRKRRLSFVD
jgi:hypothetical protein